MKPVVFLAQSLDAIRSFPEAARREAGHQLDRVPRHLRGIPAGPSCGSTRLSEEIGEDTQAGPRFGPASIKGTAAAKQLMNDKKAFASVWDALENDPVRVQNLKLRSALLMRISEELRSRGLTQIQAAELLHITQPRVSALLQGKIDQFRLDSLVDIAHRLGLRVSLEVAA
jgi:predicted XRE-type DNA-binding protein